MDKIKESEVSQQARIFLKKPAKPASVTGYKGVTSRKNSDRFYVLVWQKDGNKKCIGGFGCPIEAAKAYDTYVRENIGNWPYTNFYKNGKRRLAK